MINCKFCRNTKNCCYAGEDTEREECRDHIPTTNSDRIRSMTDEELAWWLADFETRCYLRLEPMANCDTSNFAKQLLEQLKEEVN